MNTNASQTSAMVQKILSRHNIMNAKYRNSLRLLGGFNALRVEKTDIILNKYKFSSKQYDK